MFINKNFTFREVLRFAGGHLVWITAWATAVALFYFFFHLEWFVVPWLPISVIGTAVAFYVGFKNNSAYDRLWEARKIWGAIVNSSRVWGTNVKAYVGNQFTTQNLSQTELKVIHQRLIYRHIGWLYTLRSQLLVPTSWEHVTQGGQVAKIAQKRQESWGVGLFNDEVTNTQLHKFIPCDDVERLVNYKNTATQIIADQSEELRLLREQNLIDDFRHMELQKVLNDFYTHQGQAERIKKFPLPRQYGSISFIFVGVFIFLLPFGMASEFHKLGHWAIFLSIPFTVIVSWVYVVMELVGDYSENPFEGTGNDIPMLSLCRTIEIDLKEMLGEDDIPPGIEPVNGVLM